LCDSGVISAQHERNGRAFLFFPFRFSVLFVVYVYGVGVISVGNCGLLQLRTSPTFFVSVPLGADTFVWNAERIYGERRLPRLFHGFNVHAIVPLQYSTVANIVTKPATVANTLEPVWVLDIPGYATDPRNITGHATDSPTKPGSDDNRVTSEPPVDGNDSAESSQGDGEL
jgi:hypothetical protein